MELGRYLERIQKNFKQAYKSCHDKKKERDLSSYSFKTIKWTHSIWLGEPVRSPRLFWNPKENSIEFKIEANTIGCILIQFNDNDFIILWIDDTSGKPHIEDCHLGNDSKILFRDEEENYKLLGGYQNLTHTQISFERKWNTCDVNDTVLGSDTVLVGWSIYPNDEFDKNISKLYTEEEEGGGGGGDVFDGVFKGEKFILLQSPSQLDIPKGHNVHKWDILMRNVVISNKTTTRYWCKVFRTPSLPKKSHIIAYEPMILSNYTQLIHHMFLYECEAPPGFLDSYSSSNQNGYPCYGSEMPEDWEKCITPVHHIGLPIGPRQSYFMLEIHYKDPGTTSVIDNSGFRIYYTEDLRPFDAGVMMTGVKVTPLHLVPPQQNEYKSIGLCNDVCTNKLFPLMGIKVVSVLLHSHVPTSSMRLRHIRGDNEINNIVENNKYQYEYQVNQRLKKEVTVFPSDHLITECDYITTNMESPEFGKKFSREEMCSSFVTYYPKTNLSSCHSMIPVRYFFKTIGIKSFYNVTMDDIEKYIMKISSNKIYKFSMLSPYLGGYNSELNNFSTLLKMFSDENSLLKLKINEPNEFKGKNLSAYIESLPWNDTSFTKSFENSLAKGLQIVFCRIRNNKLAIVSTEYRKFSKI
ncbi:hypothetical protein Phum_PHUM125540 [Pediculus humanus corporis]|uniref:DOMON domain-containing protein n=1 Tax=Pediculus humanus subsp. corporis TaxID=121224 RepID=E0VDU7_PEDHC|nr:uncharacterized protein Phum_PHUM125540 [Pediculus humanus corporis]EEB11553.1 hypothetical protein Phum_PHUM125540 [Pediculus humanus corporis]